MTRLVDAGLVLLRRRPAGAAVAAGALVLGAAFAVPSGRRGAPAAQEVTMLVRVVASDGAPAADAASAVSSPAVLDPIRLSETPVEEPGALRARLKLEPLAADALLRLTFRDEDTARGTRVLVALLERNAALARGRAASEAARARARGREGALRARLSELDASDGIPEAPALRAARERCAAGRDTCAALERGGAAPSAEALAAGAEVARLEARAKTCDAVALRRHPEVVALREALDAARAGLAALERAEADARAARHARAREAQATLERELALEALREEGRQQADRERRLRERHVVSQEHQALVHELAAHDLAAAARGREARVALVEGPRVVVAPAPAPLGPPSLALPIGLAVGVLACAGVPLVRWWRRRPSSSAPGRPQLAGYPVLGRVSKLPPEDDPLERCLQEGSDAAAAFKALASALAAEGLTGRSLLVTSARPGEGKSLVAVGLATALARSGRRVLLVDANASRPRLHRAFGLDRSVGLATALALDAPDLVEQLVRPSRLVPGLHALAAGLAPDRRPPAEAALGRLIAWCVERYDWVVLDGPAVTGAELLAAVATETIVVVPSASADARAETARGCLADARVTTVRVVVNDGAGRGSVAGAPGSSAGCGAERPLDQTDAWPVAPPRVVKSGSNAPDGLVAWLWSDTLSPVPLGPRPVQLGREATCDVALPFTGVSRLHATIALQGHELVLTDERSRNGSFVNGRRVDRAVLQVGDRVGIGACEFHVRAADRPVNAERVTGPVQRPAPPCAMSGSIDETPLVEVLHGLEFHRKTGVLTVHTEPGPGVLVVRDGRPVAARMGELIGETAVLAMLRVRTGRFTFTSDPAAEGKPMQATLMSLMLEASRRSDDDGLVAA